MINVALISAAHIHTPGFIKRMNETDDITVPWVWDDNKERGQEAADELQAELTDLETILGDDSIKGVVICSETDLHAELIDKCAAAGKHIFAEKPLGLGKEDSLAMAEVISKAGVLFQTGYFMRQNPINKFLKQEIAHGHFGQLSRVKFSNCHSGSLGDWFTPKWLWMTDTKRAGCGAYGDLGTHVLDILLWMLSETPQAATGSIHMGTNRYGCDEFVRI